MKKKAKAVTGIICTGCSKDSSELEEYDEDNPVVDDGTYANGKFVCTECYCKLIPLGQDVGEPIIIQARLANFNER